MRSPFDNRTIQVLPLLYTTDFPSIIVVPRPLVFDFHLYNILSSILKSSNIWRTIHRLTTYYLQQGYAAGGQAAAATGGYGTAYGGTETAGNGGYGASTGATGYGSTATADQGGYGAYRGNAATSGRQDRSYRPY